MKRIKHVGVHLECKVVLESTGVLDKIFWDDFQKYLELLKKEYAEFLVRKILANAEDWIEEKYGPIERHPL